MKGWLKGGLIGLGFLLIFMIGTFIGTFILESKIPDFGDIISVFLSFFLLPLVFGIVVGTFYDKLYNDKRKSWLNGAVIGMIIVTILDLTIYFVWLFINLKNCGVDDSFCGFEPSVVFIFSFFPVIIISGIIGAVIGLVIGKIKSKKQVEVGR